MTAALDQAYEARKERERSRQALQSLSGRDVGPIAPIKNVRRRARCRRNLRLFMETYNPAPLYFGWSKQQLRSIARLEEAVFQGAMYAFAEPRGDGKTLRVRSAAWWSASNAHRVYPLIVGANQGKGEDSLDAVKKWCRFLPAFAEDFPEVVAAVRHLAGIAQKAAGQLCCGKATMIEWGKDRVVFPTVPPPPNWPKSWPLRADGMAPTSGVILGACGLTNEGIRGTVLTLTTGEAVRPDFVLLDDPQTHESATSAAQNEAREQLIAADVLGLAGPGKTLAAVMPCTVIAPDDMVDRILDRKKHPLWRGERTKMLVTMPADLALWDPYFDLYARDAQREPPDFAESRAYYLAHREALERGAEASWPERKLPGEVSAVQSAMHLYYRNRRAFMAEYQNDPLPLVEPAPGDLTHAGITSRVNRVPRGVAPQGCTRLSAFVDVQETLLYWLVAAWEDDFTGSVVAYGAWPDQKRGYFTLREARPDLAAATGLTNLEESVYAGLAALAADLLGRDWPAEGGGALRVERCLVDSGQGRLSGLVKKFCRESAHAAALLPSKGMGIGPAVSPVGEWQRRAGERRGPEWVVTTPQAATGRMMLFDVYWWKEFMADRLRQPLGGRGALTLYGGDPDAHRMLADHVKAEHREPTTGRGRTVVQWILPPHRPDNHLLDCLVGACVAASERGVALPGLKPPPPQTRQRTSYREQWQKAREGRR